MSERGSVSERLSDLENKVRSQEATILRLHRHCRVWRLGGSLSLIVCALVLFAGAHQNDTKATIEAQQFVLRDRDGKPRITLGVTADNNSPSLNLFDEDGKQRIRLIATHAGGPGLTFYDTNDSRRLGMGLGPGGNPGLHFEDEDRTTRLGMGLGPNGAPGIHFDAQDGSSRFNMGLGFLDDPGMLLRGEDGEKRICIGLGPDNLPWMSLFDTEGNPRIEMGLSIILAGGPGLAIRDEQNTKFLFRAPFAAEEKGSKPDLDASPQRP